MGTGLFGELGTEQGKTARTLVAAAVGGTVSRITGGKFANGAITAAFVHLFNTEGGVLLDAKKQVFGELAYSHS